MIFLQDLGMGDSKSYPYTAKKLPQKCKKKKKYSRKGKKLLQKSKIYPKSTKS